MGSVFFHKNDSCIQFQQTIIRGWFHGYVGEKKQVLENLKFSTNNYFIINKTNSFILIKHFIYNYISPILSYKIQLKLLKTHFTNSHQNSTLQSIIQTLVPSPQSKPITSKLALCVLYIII